MATKAPFAMPVKQAEDLKPKSQPTPTGAYQGTIEEQRIRNLPDSFFGGDPTGRGYTSEDVEVVSLQIGGLKPMEGQEISENKKFFTPDIILRDGALEIDAGPAPDSAWQLQHSQAAAVNLAVALGFADEVGTDYVVQEAFWDALKSDGLKGMEVGFVVYHRNWESKKTGKSGTEEKVETYLQAV